MRYPIDHRAADIIGKSVQRIRLLWPMMQRSGSSGVARSRQGGDPLARQADLLDIRRNTEETLRTWARYVVRERRITHTIPNTLEELCYFLDRHSLWLAALGPDTVRAVADIAGAANRCRSAVFPARADGLWIGNCPNTVWREDGESEVCGTPIRVRAEHPGDVRCRRCGLEDTLDGWILRIVGTEGPYTASQLVGVLHRRMGIVITESGIRDWVRRGWIEPIKDDFKIRTTPEGAHLYDVHDVMARIARRERHGQ